MYLLDTNVLYWWRTGNPSLPPIIQNILTDTSNHIFYSVIAPWELSIKNAKGKLPLPKNFFPLLPKLGFDCLAIEEKHVDMPARPA